MPRNEMIRLVLIVTATILTGCSAIPPKETQSVMSPLGIYTSNSNNKYWLVILEDNNYLLCNPQICNSGAYERLPINYGVILLGFYQTAIGLALEKEIHGEGHSEQFLAAMKKIRLMQQRPDDQVFNISQCDGVPCIGIGHTREGIKFYRIEQFDDFWRQ